MLEKNKGEKVDRKERGFATILSKGVRESPIDKR